MLFRYKFQKYEICQNADDLKKKGKSAKIKRAYISVPFTQNYCTKQAWVSETFHMRRFPKQQASIGSSRKNEYEYNITTKLAHSRVPRELNFGFGFQGRIFHLKADFFLGIYSISLGYDLRNWTFANFYSGFNALQTSKFKV